MERIGITGIIGSGKSSVGRILSDMGYSVLDADKAVHALYKESLDLRHQLQKLFGLDILTEEGVSKSYLASIIFKDESKRIQLENLVYPKLQKVIQDFFKECEKKGEKKAFLEAPLLYKIPEVQNKLDQIWHVEAPEEVLLRRLEDRGMEKKDAQSRLRIQQENYLLLPQNNIQKLENACSLESLKQAIHQLLI